MKNKNDHCTYFVTKIKNAARSETQEFGDSTLKKKKKEMP
jgi:hypothetical protein